MSNLISWQNYEGVDGMGAATSDQLSDLMKSLKAGQDQNDPGVSAGQGFPLRVESLDRTLRNVTYRAEHIRLWKTLPKLAEYNTVTEYNQLSSYGQGMEGWIDEGELPSETDATYERKVALIKYMGVTKSVSHVMSLVKPAHGNVLAQETVNGTLWLLERLERALFKGDSSLDSVQFDGFETQIRASSPAGNIFDMRGRTMTEDDLIDAALTVQDAPNYGRPTHLFLNPKAKADLVKTFFPKARWETMGAPKDGKVGLDIKGFTSPAGDIMFEPDIFMDDGGGPTAAVAATVTGQAAPDVSTISVPPAAAGSAGSFAADDAGDYIYLIQGVNRFGRSATVTSAAVTVAATNSVTMTVNHGTVAPSWWEVYRSAKDGAAGTAKLIAKINYVAGATQVLTDTNSTVAGTTNAILFQMNLEALSWKQLAPMVKVPLATINTSIRWMQLLYGTPVLYTPGKIAMFENIGRAVGSINA